MVVINFLLGSLFGVTACFTFLYFHEFHNKHKKEEVIKVKQLTEEPIVKQEIEENKKQEPIMRTPFDFADDILNGTKDLGEEDEVQKSV